VRHRLACIVGHVEKRPEDPLGVEDHWLVVAHFLGYRNGYSRSDKALGHCSLDFCEKLAGRGNRHVQPDFTPRIVEEFAREALEPVDFGKACRDVTRELFGIAEPHLHELELPLQDGQGVADIVEN
jgi:hypothetical protein